MSSSDNMENQSEDLPKLAGLLSAYFKRREDEVDPEVVSLLEAAKRADQTVETLTTAVDESRSKVENLKDENKALLEENDALEQDLEDCEDKLKSCRELVDTKVKKIEEMLTAIVLHILRGENNYPAGYEIDHEFRYFAEDYLSYVGCNEDEKDEALHPNNSAELSPCPSPPFR